MELKRCNKNDFEHIQKLMQTYRLFYFIYFFYFIIHLYLLLLLLFCALCQSTDRERCQKPSVLVFNTSVMVGDVG